MKLGNTNYHIRKREMANILLIYLAIILNVQTKNKKGVVR